MPEIYKLPVEPVSRPGTGAAEIHDIHTGSATQKILESAGAGMRFIRHRETDGSVKTYPDFKGLYLETPAASYDIIDAEFMVKTKYARGKDRSSKRRLFHKVGNAVEFGRPKQLIPHNVTELTYTVNVYNQLGEQTGIKILSADELTKFVTTVFPDPTPKSPSKMAAGQKPFKAFWREPKPIPSPENSNKKDFVRTDIDLPPTHPTHMSPVDARTTYYDLITEQLEAEGITNWDGLWWEDTTGHTYGITQHTVLSERVSGKSERPIVAYVIRSMDRHGNICDVEVVKESRRSEVTGHPSGRMLADYFGDPRRAGIRKMYHLAEKKEPANPETLVQQSKDIQEMIVSQSEDASKSTLLQAVRAINRRRRRTNNPVDLDPDMLRDEIRAEREAEKPDIIAAWLLSYADNLTDNDPETRQKRLRRLDNFTQKAIPPELMKSVKPGEISAEHRRKEALKEILRKHGVAKVVDVALRLQDEFTKSAEMLSLPMDEVSKSISWVMEGLVDRYYYAKYPFEANANIRGARFGDPFEETTEASCLQRDTVDKRVGILFSSKYIRQDAELKPTKIINSEGQPRYEVKEIIDYTKEPLLHMQGIIFNEVRQTMDKIHMHVTKHENPPAQDLVYLGRLMRRTIAQ